MFSSFLRHNSLLRSVNAYFLAVLIVLGSISFPTFSRAQEELDWCGADAPSTQELLYLRERTEQWLDETSRAQGIIFTIPVAFHVVRYDNGNADVTDQQIEDQIDVLNAGFANTNFQFGLSSINRVDNDEWSAHEKGSTEEEEMKQTLAIDPAHTLNFYTCGWPKNENGDPIKGYSTLPWWYTEGSYMHGVVVRSRCLPGGAEQDFNLGDVGTHEVGHYVGLLHTFEGNNCWPGDLVDDTPPEDRPSYTCPTGRNTCIEPDPDPPDPIDNFMDYSYDSCRDHFTDGQSDRMLSQMAQHRPSMVPVQVVVDQRRNNGSRLSGTTIDRWTDPLFTELPITSQPNTFSTNILSREVLRGYQQLVANPTEKYRVWERNQVEQLDTVQNHRGFTIALDYEDLTSRFYFTYDSIIIRNEFLSAPGADPTDDIIEFKDPWFIDYPDPNYENNLRNRGMDDSGPDALRFWTRSSPLYPDYDTPFGQEGYKYRGVFLNQPYDNPPNPYYSVRAPNPQTIPFHGQDIEWYFQKWSGTDVQFEHSNQLETAVVFNEPNAVARAEYKGHLASNTTDAISLNNQRKMVFDGSNYHMVYVDNGEIYYTKSIGVSDSWEPEIKLSSGGDNKWPSIAIDGSGNILVVWQEYVSILGQYFNGSSWEQIYPPIYVMFHYIAGDATPVVDFLQDRFYIVFRNFDLTPGKNLLQIIDCRPSNGEYSDPEDVDGTNSNSRFPSLASDRSYLLHLAWEEQGSIYYCGISGNSNTRYEFNPSKESVSQGTGYYDHVYPCITTDSRQKRRPNIMWEAWSGPATEMQIILHRRRKMNWPNPGWGITSVFSGNDDYYKPSITGFPGMGENNGLRAAWTRGFGLYSMIWLAEYDGSSWTNFWPWGTYGVDPRYCATNDDGEMLKMVYRRSELDLPYILKTTSDFPSPHRRSSPAQFTLHRRGVLTLDNSEIAFELGEFKIDGNPVNLLPLADTLVESKTGVWEDIFRTEPFPISSQLSLSYFRGFEVVNPNTLSHILPKGIKIKLRLEVVNAKSGKVITTPDLQAITSDVPSNSREFKNLLFDLGGNQEVFLRVGLDLPKGIPIKQSMVEVYYIEDSQDSFQKPFANENTTSSIKQKPSSFALGNNYPNPFNPVTTIAFDLPSNGYVNLDIYDISGRRVKTLVNKNMDAGRYHIVLDGHDEYGNEVASGTYFYRIKTGSFRNIKKMVLLR